MQLVATVQAAPDLDAAVSALVTAAGMTAAEARMRLAPEPPALLARLSPDRAAAVVAALGRAGVVALAIDEDLTRRERFQARSFALEDGLGRFISRSGETLTLRWDTVQLVLRGVRTARTTTERSETSRKLSVGRAVLTGGLVMTRTTTSTVRGSQEDTEQFILVHGSSDARVLLAEGTLEFSGLGPLLQPARTANMGVLAEELKHRAPRAFHDDRLLRLGRRALPFVLGGEHAVHAGDAAVRRTDTGASVDLLAEVLDEAVRRGLLGAARIPRRRP